MCNEDEDVHLRTQDYGYGIIYMEHGAMGSGSGPGDSVSMRKARARGDQISYPNENGSSQGVAVNGCHGRSGTGWLATMLMKARVGFREGKGGRGGREREEGR